MKEAASYESRVASNKLLLARNSRLATRSPKEYANEM